MTQVFWHVVMDLRGCYGFLTGWHTVCGVSLSHNHVHDGSMSTSRFINETVDQADDHQTKQPPTSCIENILIGDLASTRSIHTVPLGQMGARQRKRKSAGDSFIATDVSAG
jgi:hypothetical protein